MESSEYKCKGHAECRKEHKEHSKEDNWESLYHEILEKIQPESSQSSKEPRKVTHGRYYSAISNLRAVS